MTEESVQCPDFKNKIYLQSVFIRVLIRGVPHKGFIQDFVVWGKRFVGHCHSVMHE